MTPNFDRVYCLETSRQASQSLPPDKQRCSSDGVKPCSLSHTLLNRLGMWLSLEVAGPGSKLSNGCLQCMGQPADNQSMGKRCEALNVPYMRLALPFRGTSCLLRRFPCDAVKTQRGSFQLSDGCKVNIQRVVACTFTSTPPSRVPACIWWHYSLTQAYQ